MAEQADKEDKTEDPSGRKLAEAAQKGDVARSPDIPIVMSLAAGGSVLLFGLTHASGPFLQSMSGFWRHAGVVAVDGPAIIGLIPYLAKTVIPLMAVIMGTCVAASVFGNIVQAPPVLTTDKIKPKLENLSLIKGFKKMFSGESFVQFLKSMIKMIIVTAAIFTAAQPIFTRMQEFAQMDITQLLPIMRDLAAALLLAALIAYVALTLLDYVHQKFAFLARMRMTKQEAKDEHKTTEGDPHIKAKLRMIRMEKSRQRMMQRVPQATVVITNPTHYAVALKYDQDESDAPICVAKGVDSLALKIRAVAEGADVAVIEDPPLARALYASVEIDEMIPAEHFKAVAKIIGVIYRRKKAGVA